MDARGIGERDAAIAMLGELPLTRRRMTVAADKLYDRRAWVGAVRLPVEIHHRIPSVVGRSPVGVLWLETLVASPRLGQRAVNREVLVGQQDVPPGCGEHFRRERIGDVALKQALVSFEKTVASQIGSSRLNPTNHRYGTL